MSTFENDLRLEEIGTGERAGTWGTATNTNLELIANALSYSSTGEAIANASTHTITMADGAEDEFRSFYLKCTGGGQACTVTLAPNTLSKVWMIENTTSATLTFSQGSGANVAVLAGQVKIIGTNGVGNAGAVFDLMQDLAVPDLFVDDDLTLQSDAAVLGFGADKDVTLTHVHDAGLLLNAAMKIQFRDAALSIGSSADGQLDIIADTEIQIAATTIDINGAINASGEISAVSLDISGDVDVDGTLETDALSLNGTAVTSTAAELNILDGVTSTAAELNILDGVTSTTAELNILDGVTSTTAELNILDGVTSTAAELNILDGVTSTTAELNILDGATVVVAEINALDVGSTAFGTAVASKAVILDSNKDSTGIRNLTLTGNLTIPNDGLFAATNTAGNILVADGTNFNSTAVSSLSEISTAANDDVFLAIDTSGGGLKKITRSTVLAGTGSSTDIANVVEDTSPQLGGNLDMNGQDIVTVSNATIDLAPNGTGTVVVRGNTNSGAIVFNCESNTHGQKVFGQPHSASVTNTLMLPAGADSTLLSRVSVDTLTNKTLTSPKINEDVAVTSTATELNILDGVTSTTAELNILDGVTSTAAELNILDGVTSTAAELNILDGVTSTTAEINLIDGGTARGTTAVADGDGVLINDAGTMRMTSVDTLSTYMSGKSVGGTGIVTTGALDAGSITSGFGTIDTGASAITTTGLISGGSLDIDSVLINGATIGHTDDTDLMTVADGILTVAGEVQMTTLDIGGTNVTSTAAELNILDGVTSTAAELNILDGVTATAAEINLIDGGATIGTTAVADGDGILINDGGTMRVSTVQTVKTYMTAGAGAPTGTLIYHAANAAPTGYLKANGATISRSTYSALFSAIGTTFGAGDGSSTFLVPDLRGEFIRAWDDSRGVDGSRAFGSAQGDAFKAHTHGVLSVAFSGGVSAPQAQSAGANYTTYNTTSTGGSETRSRNIALLACIKY